jgi:translocation and assembly module TamA
MGRSSRNLLGRLSMRLVIALAACVVAFCDRDRAQAFDFFGLWSSVDSAPPVSPAAISYSVAIDVAGDDSGIRNAVTDASSLYKLRKDAPPDGEALARRAESDFKPVIDALWGAGYYNATVTISLDAASLTIASSDVAAFTRAAESYRNRAVAPVAIKVDPGPLFRLRSIRVVNAAGIEFSQDELPPRIVGLKPGDPAVAGDLRAAEARIIDWFRNQGRPLAKVQSIAPIVDHAAQVMDVTVTADPGPVAPFGEATMTGPESFDPGIARSFLYIQPGDPYSPRAVQDARTSIRQIPAVGGVRITEGTALDAYGRLPYQIDVEDRLPYAVGGAVQYSTTNGPAGQVYWEDRNVFGGAEQLRLQADIFYAPPWYVTSPNVQSYSIHDLGGRLSASFLKPALWDTRNDLLINALAERMSTAGAGFFGYQAEDVDTTVALRHRFSQYFSFQAGLEGQTGSATDVLGKVDYTLVGVPLSVTYDSTDSKLNPTSGFRVTASAAGFPTFLGSSLDLVQAKVRASAYYALDADQRFVLAGRIGLGAMGGPALDEIPANWLFYAGGGGSVRGYAFNSLGPTGIFDAVIGGRSLFEASAELRVRVTDTIGIVPFFDAGNAFASTFPDFNEPLFSSVGLGLRYFTAVGPIRLDVAFPLERHAGNGPVAVYVSIGQAF